MLLRILLLGMAALLISPFIIQFHAAETYCLMDMLHISRRPYQNLLDKELECIRKKESDRYSGIYHHPAKNEEDHNEK